MPVDFFVPLVDFLVPVDFEPPAVRVVPLVDFLARPADLEPLELRAAPVPVDFFATVDFDVPDFDALDFDAAAFVPVAFFAAVEVLRVPVPERRLFVPGLGSASPTVFAT